ncbi:MAG: hypothetical protein H0U76_22245 [Ktedonobacteraceae bacterium]|nr:hypothetical protein [Ktedonobacteraceae bacterium]
MKLEGIQFSRENNVPTIIGYFADWQRNHETHVVVVYRSSDNLLNHRKELIAQLDFYENNKLTEQEARAIDAEVVNETYKQYKMILREGLVSLLGEDPTTNQFSDAACNFAAPQLQYIEAQALKEIMKEVVRDMVTTNPHKKHMWYQIGEVANTYLDYCRSDLFTWAKEVILPEVLPDLPEVERANVTHLFETIEQHPSLWERHIDIALRPRK